MDCGCTGNWFTGSLRVPTPDVMPLTQRNSETLQVACFSDPGFGSTDSDNQDVFVVKTLDGDAALVVGALFDGHGMHGRAVAHQAKDGVFAAVSRHTDEAAEGLKKSFGELHAESLAASVMGGEVDVSESGVSATVVVYDGPNHRLSIANVGDSKAVLGTGVPRPGAAQLTFDHYPSVTCERERIEAAGGRVSATNDVQLGEIGEILVRRGDTNLPGLGISRSIGDSAAKEVGVCAEPSVMEVQLTPLDRFLVLGSAGVWKVFSPREIVELVGSQPDASCAVHAVVEGARVRWKELWQGENTTVAVLVFPNEPPW